MHAAGSAFIIKREHAARIDPRGVFVYEGEKGDV